MFETEWIEPEKGKTNSTLWRKHKETGIITGFNRGKQIESYRLKIIDKSK